MSAFYGAPAGPHIGQCQNFILLDGSDRHGRYCLAPVLGLGSNFPSDLDICQVCRGRTEVFRQRTVDRFVDGLDAEAARIWLGVAERIIAEMELGYAERAARRASMEELFKTREDIERRQALVDAVLAAFPPPVATSQSLL